jgi:hypothetical protein
VASDEEEHVFKTGASRSKLYARYDLISPIGLRRLAERYALGAEKRGDHNWRKGMPMSAIIQHMLHHLTLFQLEGGSVSDDHAAAVAWGAIALAENEELRPETNDLYPFTKPTRPKNKRKKKLPKPRAS